MKKFILILVLLVPLVSAQPTGPGDVNGDLMVDLNDLIMMTVNLGNSGFDPVTDINSDGRVNIFDMVVVARNYGNDYSGGGDTTPPVVTLGTTTVTYSVNTNENANCRYSTSSGTSYTSMNNFDTTGGATHSETASGLSIGTYDYYIRCRDTAGNANTNDFTKTITIGSSSSSGGPNVYFWSDWSTATGNTDVAIRDTSKARPWTSCDFGACGEVLSTSANGRDYPTNNYLLWTTNDGHLSVFSSSNYIPVPQVGDSVFVRYYYQDRVPNSEVDSDGTHPDYFDEDFGGTNWGPQALGLYPYHQSNGLFNFRLSAGLDQDPRYFTPQVLLSKFTTYRYEYGYTRTGTNTYQLFVRIYDSSGILLYDTSSFCDDFWYDCVGEELLGRTFTATGAAASSMTGFRIGNNGFNPANNPPFDLREYAGLAICDDWCGPYPIAGVEDQ